MAEDKMNPASHAQSLDARILRVLKTAPRLEIPSDFAARVARQLPPRPRASFPLRDTVTVRPWHAWLCCLH